MTTTDYLSRELRRARMSLHRAEKKPNTPESELRGLRDKIACLEEALAAVQWRDRAQPHLDRDSWKPCEECGAKKCETCHYCDQIPILDPCDSCVCGSEWKPLYKFCHDCGRPLAAAAWSELERRVCGG